MPSRIILAGGTGFLGQVLTDYFGRRGCEVVSLARGLSRAQTVSKTIRWDGETLGSWARVMEGATAVVNLAGRSVNCRYHSLNRRLILDSRVNSTRAIGAAISHCAAPPPVWLNASTATIYKHTFGSAWDERGEVGGTPEAKDRFSVEVAQAWEQALQEATTPKTRKVALRTAMVLGAGRNSVLPVLRRLVRLGLGGAMAGGSQFVSWIHEADFCRAVEWLIERSDFSGPVNVAAPNPLTNREMMRLLRQACAVRVGLPASQCLLELGAFLLRTETELIIKSRRVVPARLLASGFEFRFPFFSQAVADLFAERPR
jgi:uncharacterized protein (TIGR01777 family)